MMIKCSKCGFENQMGSIFCRGCGEKIDMNSLDPETIAKAKNASERGKRTAKVIRNIVGLVILLIIIGAVSAAFIPCGDAYVAAPESALKSATSKIELVGAEKIYIVPRDTAFTVDEINALFNQRFMSNSSQPAEAPAAEAPAAEGAQEKPAAEPKDEKGFYVIDNVQFSIHDGKLHVTLYVSLAGKVPMTMLLVGTPKVGDEVSPVGFDIESASWGAIPMDQDFLRGVVADKFAPLAGYPELRNLFKRTDKIEVKDNKIVFNFRKDNAKKSAKQAGKK